MPENLLQQHKLEHPKPSPSEPLEQPGPLMVMEEAEARPAWEVYALPEAGAEAVRGLAVVTQDWPGTARREIFLPVAALDKAVFGTHQIA